MDEKITLTIEEYADTLLVSYKEGFDTAIYILEQTSNTIDLKAQKERIIKSLTEKFNPQQHGK